MSLEWLAEIAAAAAAQVPAGSLAALCAFEPKLREEQARAVGEATDRAVEELLRVCSHAGRGGTPPEEIRTLLFLSIKAAHAAANAYDATPDEQKQIAADGRAALLALENAGDDGGKRALVLRELYRQGRELLPHLGTEHETAEETCAMHNVGIVCELVSKRTDRVVSPNRLRAAVQAWARGTLRGKPRKGVLAPFTAANDLLEDIGLGAPSPTALERYWESFKHRTPAARP